MSLAKSKAFKAYAALSADDARAATFLINSSAKDVTAFCSLRGHTSKIAIAEAALLAELCGSNRITVIESLRKAIAKWGK